MHYMLEMHNFSSFIINFQYIDKNVVMDKIKKKSRITHIFYYLSKINLNKYISWNSKYKNKLYM